MGDPARRRATYQDLIAVPDTKVAEIIDGELYVSPRPASPHAHAASTLGMDLGGAFHRGRGGPGGWWILYEPELHLGPDVLVPDLAGWRRERMPQVPRTAAFELPPDWLAEVLSPSTEKIDRARKLSVYARARVSHVWLVDPLLTTIEVLRLDGDTFRIVKVHAGDESARLEPFEAIELEVGALWLKG